MKQATQLEIQWPEPCDVQASAIDRMEISAARALSRTLPMIKLIAKATLCVLFSFGMVFLAAILQG